MPTLNSMVTQIQRRCANHTLLTTAIATEMANAAHEELIEAHEWSRRRLEIFVETVAQKTTGTVAVTNGSSAVTFAGASLAAADQGKYIRIATDSSLYVIGGIVAQTAVLQDFNGTATPYGGTTNALASFVMFQRWYSLGSGIEAIDVVSYKSRVYERTLDWLDMRDPLRSTTGDPVRFIRGPRSSTDIVQVEFWPRPTGIIVIRFNVIRGHTDLSGTQTPIVPGPVVVAKGAVLSCYFIYSKDKDERWLQLAQAHDKEFNRVFELHKRLDEAKFGLPRYIQDVRQRGLAGSDYYLDKDEGI